VFRQSCGLRGAGWQLTYTGKWSGPQLSLRVAIRGHRCVAAHRCPVLCSISLCKLCAFDGTSRESVRINANDSSRQERSFQICERSSHMRNTIGAERTKD